MRTPGLAIAALVVVGWVGRASAEVPDTGGDVRLVVEAQLQWLAGSADDRPPPPKMFGDDAVFSLPDLALVRGGAALRSELTACAPQQQPKLEDYEFNGGLAGAAWVSFTVKFQSASAACGAPPVYRASEVLAVRDGWTEWRVVAGAWSRGVADDDADAAAQAGELKAATLGKGPGDAGVAARLTELASHGVDADAAARDDVVVFGTAPGERTRGGKVFAAGWRAAWVGHVSVDGPVIASAMGDAMVGWAIANLVLEKRDSGKPFHVPVRAFLVFGKREGSNTWTLAHVHLAVPTPRLDAGSSDKHCGAELDVRVRSRLYQTRRMTQARDLTCVTGRFRIAGKVTPATYVELGYAANNDFGTARALMSTDGSRELLPLTTDPGARGDQNETLEAIDLDGDGADELVADNYAFARAEIHQIYVKGIDGPQSNFVRYAIDMRPKDIQGYCEGTVARERAGKATHFVVTMTKLEGETSSGCLAKGRHVFAYEHGQLVEQRH